MPRRHSPASPYADGEAFSIARAALNRTPPDVTTAEKMLEHMLKSDRIVMQRRIDAANANRSDHD